MSPIRRPTPKQVVRAAEDLRWACLRPDATTRQRQAQREGSTAANALADDDRAAHRLRELGRDRKPEADAVPHVARHERAQDRLALGLRDAGAGVAHDDQPRCRPLARPRR